MFRLYLMSIIYEIIIEDESAKKHAKKRTNQEWTESVNYWRTSDIGMSTMKTGGSSHDRICSGKVDIGPLNITLLEDLMWQSKKRRNLR